VAAVGGVCAREYMGERAWPRWRNKVQLLAIAEFIRDIDAAIPSGSFDDDIKFGGRRLTR
jgi:hypothetical protein